MTQEQSLYFMLGFFASGISLCFGHIISNWIGAWLGKKSREEEAKRYQQWKEQEELEARFYYKNSKTKQHVFELRPLIKNDIFVIQNDDEYDFIIDDEVESCLVACAEFFYDTDKPYVKLFIGGETEEESKIVFHLSNKKQRREYCD